MAKLTVECGVERFQNKDDTSKMFVKNLIRIMAKKSMIERHKKRVRMYELYRHRRKVFREKRNRTEDVTKTFEYGSILQKFPRNSAAVRVNRRCIITGRPKGVYRVYGLSRQVFREMAHQGLLPGITKSSW